MDRFYECFSDVEDPRAGNSQHDLLEILFIALLGSLCGATSCADMAEFGLSKEPLLRSVLSLAHGIPSHDTFSRVFRQLDPVGFEAAFRQFMAEFARGARVKKTAGVVALDGKLLRRSYERGRQAMPCVMVTAWGAATRMSLASTVAADGNETEAALRLVELLQLKGCVVTGDALHCNRAMAEAVITRGGDYVLALKSNQRAMLRDAEALFAAAIRPPEHPARKQPSLKSASRAERAHGRDETRLAIVIPAPKMALDHGFPGIVALARIDSRRGIEPPVSRLFALSKRFSAERVLDIVRDHWGIENRLHWTLDVTFDEDLARNRKDNGPANLAVLRRLALNIANAHPDIKTSIRRKLLRAGWDENFLFDLIRHMR
jgi:predicted transposase YbfD/YdcC